MIGSRIGVLASLAVLLGIGGCGLNPTYTVRIDNETNKTLRASLERRPTLNEVIGMDSASVRANSSRVLGPSEARPFERVYVVIGDRTDLHAIPESLEISRGEWIVTIGSGSITSWGTYELKIRKADESLIPDQDEPGQRSDE